MDPKQSGDGSRQGLRETLRDFFGEVDTGRRAPSSSVLLEWEDGSKVLHPSSGSDQIFHTVGVSLRITHRDEWTLFACRRLRFRFARSGGTWFPETRRAFLVIAPGLHLKRGSWSDSDQRDGLLVNQCGWEGNTWEAGDDVWYLWRLDGSNPSLSLSPYHHAPSSF